MSDEVTQQIEIRQRLAKLRLREVLFYDPEAGVFTWKVSLGNKAPIGAVAGSIGYYGYRTIRIDQRDYRASRLAFFYMTGEWPPELVDHIDGDRANDRWANLRPATRSQNGGNAKRRTDQKTFKGVSFHKKLCRWSASIRGRHIGLFNTAQEASAAYATAARATYGDFARSA